MKPIIRSIVVISMTPLLILGLFVASCKKVEIANNWDFKAHLQKTNHPPIANAGADQTIRVPDNSIVLDASNSFDLNNNIISYAWTKIFGPSLFTIVNTASPRSQVTDLVEGVYQFELKVSDRGGLSSKDTVNVNVIGPTVSGDNPLFIENLIWEFDNINKAYFMRSPTLSASQLSNINEIDLLFYDLPPFGGYLWQPIERDGTTPGIFYYKIENNSVVAYMYCDGGCEWWMQYVMPRMAIYFN